MPYGFLPPVNGLFLLLLTFRVLLPSKRAIAFLDAYLIRSARSAPAASSPAPSLAHLIPIRLYQILEEHSDQGHPLSMGELRRLLQVAYGVSCDRRRAGCDIPDFQDSREGLKLWAMQYMERREIQEPGWPRQQMERFFFEGWSLYRCSNGQEPIGQEQER